MKEVFELTTGGKLPKVGLGTYRATDQNEVNKVMKWAIDDMGYRNIDTAHFYYNEDQIGAALNSIKTPRKDVFITTKLWVHQIVDEKTIRQAVNEALKKLQTDYIDLLLIHWPYTSDQKINYDNDLLLETLVNAWTVMEKLYKEGTLKNIGVSNFLPKDLDAILEKATVPPAVNEIEFHPFLDQDTSVNYCKKHNIQVIGYRTIYTHREHPVVVAIAKEVNKTEAQVLIRWGIQHGVAMIPKSTNEGRLRQNTQVFDFSLSDDQMKRLDALKTANKRYCCDPSSKQSLDVLLTL
mmetsp:Transcript_7872/g.11678  ORF Transcript_7872/g.11678 Transcript_7872/m.11678 type:complete len:294 (+) Transcript_7872:38-919(+)|eukprot:CAMPEP_0117424290 /NCGR_PEP_ID=MMETSP0758-20121206/4738_1 /TAXON_ID=63605 /ORGANISM="Percolomonas cosmopolitus, Strain AE-1 (ATCC 50343)" /LENGTH=293 /DNA_ID=CAMNT_0005207979 /DNA_START=25 /DNA_END=906 /DNA_ORIENTATION=-